MDGFLPGRGSLILDFVFVATIAALPILAWSIISAKRGGWARHRKVQIILTTVLGLAVLVFEIEMRRSGWRHLAEPSPYYPGPVWVSLSIHLFFAVTTLVIWTMVFVRALRNFSKPPEPGAHSNFHRRWGRIAAIDYALTVISGAIFYYLAFMA